MNELLQFSQHHIELASIWIVVLLALMWVQFKVTLTAPKAISVHQLTQLVNREKGVVIDIRNTKEFNQGHIHGALNIPLSRIKENIKRIEKYNHHPIIMVCTNGISVASACSLLKKSGIDSVFKLQGGINAWSAEHLPLVK
jgi:rhodanese-related sulfurtransferase